MRLRVPVRRRADELRPAANLYDREDAMRVDGRAVRSLLAAALCLGPLAARAAERRHWSYDGETGPARWGDLEAEFAACKLGRRQSPIDITAPKRARLPPVAFDYRPSPATVIDNGHTIQVKVKPGSGIDVGGKRFQLVQFHFHRPSEEKVKGKAFAMDAHLVHQAADGKLAVVAVLLEPGAANGLVDAVWTHAPKGHGESAPGALTVDPSRLLPADRGYYAFTGSLTTPPCTEGVSWIVLRSPVAISREQVTTFAERYPHNARPAQPLGDREVHESD
jgi:carbonic anhydrase